MGCRNTTVRSAAWAVLPGLAAALGAIFALSTAQAALDVDVDNDGKADLVFASKGSVIFWAMDNNDVLASYDVSIALPDPKVWEMLGVGRADLIPLTVLPGFVYRNRSTHEAQLVLVDVTSSSLVAGLSLGVRDPKEEFQGFLGVPSSAAGIAPVWRHRKTREVRVQLVDLSDFPAYVYFDVLVPGIEVLEAVLGERAEIVGFAEFGGAPFDEIVLRFQKSGLLHVLPLAGPAGGSVTPPAGAVVDPRRWTLAAVTDMLGTVTPDFVWQDPKTGDVYIWDIDAGTETFVGTPPKGFQIVGCADFDGGIGPDILFRNKTDLLIWRNIGAPLFVVSPVDPLDPEILDPVTSKWRVIAPTRVSP
jgi:hypothetical protein